MFTANNKQNQARAAPAPSSGQGAANPPGVNPTSGNNTANSPGTKPTRPDIGQKIANIAGQAVKAGATEVKNTAVDMPSGMRKNS